MNRLTEKVVNDKNVYVQRSIKQYGNLSTGEPLYTSIYTNKLGKIEDLMEKYEIEDLVELEIALDQYYHRYNKVETRRVDDNE